MHTEEIVLPDTEPETEWILGRPVQKMSPFRDHGRLQAALSYALWPWAAGRGEIAPEWRFRVAPPGEVRRPLVPDLAYVSNPRLAGLEGMDLQAPPLAPDVAIEILSPSRVKRHVEHKIGVYLAAGSLLVIVIDARDRSVRLHGARGVQVLRGNDVIAHDALPGFALALPTLFAALDRKR